jgi:hypothetical protein
MTKMLGCWGCLIGLLLTQAPAADFQINSNDRLGNITWTGAFTNGICTVETAPTLTSQWRAQQSCFTTNSSGQGTLMLTGSNSFFRLLKVDVSTNTPAGYTNLLQSYGLLRTIAGNGLGGTDGVNYWQPGFEGGYATNAALSRPHFAMGDDAGDILIVDKGSHSVLLVTSDGRIHTVAGTHTAGNGPDIATPATLVQMNAPNGLWVRGDGTFYVLDTGNSKIRRVDTNGVMTTLVDATVTGISTGRGLWVKDDESLAYFASGKDFKMWTPAGAIQTLNNNFNELGTFIQDPSGDLIVTDRGASKVYYLVATGSKTGNRNVLYGDGNTNAVVDGTLAKTNSLYGVRGIWPLPTGGYLLATHEGSQVLYVDRAGLVHVLVNGLANAHAGDGQWFHSPGYKISETRSVSLDRQGNILITESDFGYVRRIDFTRLIP